MKKLALTLLLASLPLSNFAFATETAAVKTSSFKVIHANDLEQLMKTEAANVHVFDANDDKTRKSDGMIPSAKALASSSHYDVATLPADKNSKVVFYCYNTSCTASHDAAKVAMKAGYTNVYVMADGIDGWKKAGKPTQKFDQKG
jgi:rhodanese-related sulfurtransferase